LTDTNRPKRPNANYKLSRDNGNVNGKEELTFYYNRERRLEKAPQSVKDLYDENKRKSRSGLIKVLVADKPRAFVFFTILIMSAVILILSLLNYTDGSYLLDGNKLEINGIKYEGMSIMAIKKTRKNTETAYSGVIDIAVSPAVQEGEEFPVFYHRVFFSMDNEEEYRFTVPFDSPELLMILQTEKNTLKIRFRPE
jgi:hypothetical protein